MASIFTKIIQGEIPCYKIYEDEHCFCFLDIRPIQLGHTLIVPKKEVDHIDDIDEATYAHLFHRAQKLSKILKQVTGCLRVGILVEWMEVPHAHIHIVPLFGPGELSFAHSKERPEEDMKNIHAKIVHALSL